MDASALASKIATLERSLDSVEWWLEFWTFMVVLGLIVEYVVPIKQLILERPLSWKLFREAIGGLLITAGVAGELVVGSQVSTVSSDLRTANGEHIALLQKENIQLRTDLETAKAESSAKQTEMIVEQAKLAKEQQKVAQAQKEAADAQLALKKYLEMVAKRQEPRRLDVDKFLKALRDKPKGTAQIVYQPNDPEAHRFADEIETTLSIAGWRVSPAVPIPPEMATEVFLGREELSRRYTAVERVGGQPAGVTIVTNLIGSVIVTKQTPYTALIEAFLASSLFGIGATRDNTLPDNVFRIVVGPKT